MIPEEMDARRIESKARKIRIDGLNTEMYTRIVGYYRSVKDWNVCHKNTVQTSIVSRSTKR